MINLYIIKTHVTSRMLNSSLGKLFEGYVSHLHLNGYNKNTIPIYCRALEHFGQWMRINSLSVNNINNQNINKFIKNHLPKCKCPTPCTKDCKTIRAALKQLLIFLTYKGIYISDDNQKEEDFLTRFLKEYEEYLIKICGISENTSFYRKRYIAKFMTSINLIQLSDINYIKPQEVINFIKQYSHYYKSNSIRVVVSSLQNLFHYLSFKGFDTKKLLAAIPQIPNWKLSEIPDYFNDEKIEKILSSFNRKTPSGKRDYAMARFFTDLGLRCSEVSEVALCDIDWHEGILSIPQGKTKKDKLPLPKPLGEAIIDYLQHGRPKTECKFLFVHHRAPYGQKASVETVRGALRRAYQRAGLSGFTGTHILRRSLATRMLHSGASLKEIADILRHQCIDTAMIYTKVDLPHLKGVALPWLGE